MLAPTATATKRAKPWHIAIATKPAGSRAAFEVNFPAFHKTNNKSKNFADLTNHMKFEFFVIKISLSKSKCLSISKLAGNH